MNNCMFIILGASGDLAKRKLLPALYQLIAKNKLHNFFIVGASIDQISANTILQNVQQYIPNIDHAVFARMAERFVYQQLDFTQLHDYERLAAAAAAYEQQYHLSGNRIIYAAAASDFYCTITKQTALSKLAVKYSESAHAWHRIVYEKPFGHDLQSAHEINACIARYFDEKQIYRVDHYLTKELVANIALIRFTNIVLEPLWNNQYIDNVQIIVSEELGIEKRGAYYDAYGALKDIVQNHALELLALIGMESPEWLNGEYIRAERAKVLAATTIVDLLLGQYEGYRQEMHVKPTSNTETFAAVYATINNARWAGVPFYIKTGKRLAKKETVIYITFKQVDCLLSAHCPSEPNCLTMRIFPDATFSLRLNAKKPGITDQVVPVTMEFPHQRIFGAQSLEAYEVIFQEIIKGESALSVRFDEIELAWNIVDSIATQKRPVYAYAQGSAGPKEMEQFNKTYNIRWLS